MIKTVAKNDVELSEIRNLEETLGGDGRSVNGQFLFFPCHDGRIDAYEKLGAGWVCLDAAIVSFREFVRQVEKKIDERDPRKVTMAEVCAEFGEEVVIEKETV